MAIEFEKTEQKKISEKYYKIGDTFIDENGDPCSIVSISSDMVLMVCFSTGKRWGNGTKVDNTDNITNEEFYKICRSSVFIPCDFILTIKK